MGLVHVTGARGQLGGHVLRALHEIGEVDGTDVGEMDITRLEHVLAVLKTRRPDVIVHLAALKGSAPSREQPLEFFHVNTMGTLHLLEACWRLGIPRFVFVSSLSVHGRGDHPLDEMSPVAPQHPYGGSKAAAEAMVQAYAAAYGLRAVIFRPNFIVGPLRPPQPYTDNLIYDFMLAVDREGVIELAGDGSFQREWVHPQDVAEAIRLAVQEPPSGCEVFVLANNRSTMRGLAEAVIRRMGRGKITTNPARPGFTLIASAAKAARVLGWAPRVQLEEIIDEIWDEYQTRTVTPKHPHHGH